MKNKIVKTLVVAGLTLSSSLAFAGCGENEITIKDYSFVGYDEMYDLNETFSIEGLKLNLKMSDGSTKEITITEDMIQSLPDTSTVGEKTVIIEFEGKEYSFTFTVFEEVYAITAVTGIQSTYALNESLAISSDATLTYITSENETKTVTLTSSMISGFDSTSAGTKTLYISYEGKTFSFNYAVSAENEEPVEPEQPSNEVLSIVGITGVKTTYALNEQLQLGSNATLSYLSKDLEVKTVQLTLNMLSGFDSSSYGAKTLLVSYQGSVYNFAYVVYQEVYSITAVTGITKEYELNAQLELSSDATLTYVTSTLETKTVPLTLSMISGFDSSTYGVKFLTVSYEGKTFYVEYVVSSDEYELMKDALNSFLENYNNQANVGSTTAKLDYNALFKFLKDTAEESGTYSGTLSEEEITNNKYLYDFIIKNVVNSTTNKGTIVEPSNLTSKLEVVKALKDISKSLKALDYYDVIVNKCILTESDAYYAGMIRDYVSDAFGIVSEKGQNEVYVLAINTLTSVRNQTEIDVETLLTDFDEIFQEYSTMNELKSVVNGLRTSVEAYINEFGNLHALSYAISQAEELFLFEVFNKDDSVYEVQDSVLSAKYATLLSDLIYQFELLPTSENYENSVIAINECLDKLIALHDEIGVIDYDGDVYYNYLACYDKGIFTMLKNAIEDYEIQRISATVDSIKVDGIVKVVADSFDLNGDAADVLVDYLCYILTQTPVDEEQFIIDFCASLGLNSTEYLVEYRTNGNVQFLTQVLNYLYNEHAPEDGSEVVAKDEILDFAKYIDSLQTEALDADTLIAKINAILKAEYESLSLEGNAPDWLDLAVNLTSYGTDYKSIVNHIADKFVEMQIPEGATNYYIDDFERVDSEFDGVEIVTIAPSDSYGVGDLIKYSESYGDSVYRVIGVVEESGTTYYVCNTDYSSEHPYYETIQTMITNGATTQAIQDVITGIDIVEASSVQGKVIGLDEYRHSIKSEVIYLVRDFINNGDMDKEQFITAFCEQMEMDSEQYLTEYRENGTCSIFTDLVNGMIDVDSAESDLEKAKLEALIELISYADNIFSDTFETNEFISLAHTWSQAKIDYFESIDQTTTDELILYYATSNTAVMVKDLIASRGENFDVEKFIETVCDDFGFDKETYLTNYQENGTCYILRDVFDNYYDLTTIEDETEKAMLEDLREVAVAIDELFTNDYDFNNLKKKVNAYTLSLIKYDQENDEEVFVTPEVYATYFATSETVVMVKDLLVSGSENFDVEKFIETVCDEFGFDKETYLKNYQEHGTCYILRDVFDSYFNLEEIEDSKEKQFYEDVREIAIYLDEYFAGEFEFDELISKVNTASKSAIDYAEQGSPAELMFKPLYYATLMREDWLNVLIDDHSYEIKSEILPIMSQLLKIKEGSTAYNELDYLVTLHLENYIDDEFDLSVLVEDLFEFVDTYCEEDVKTYSKSISVMLGAIFYDEGIDYNELFAFIELPEGIQDVDYNKLIEKLVTEDTYKAVTISDINVQHITEEGVVVKEILTIDFKVEFDMLFLSQIDATGTLTLEIEF